MTVRQLLATIDTDELTHWIAYSGICPIGDDRGDIQAAQICATIGNRSGGRDGTPFSITDYLLRWGEDEDMYPTPEELLAKVKRIHSVICEVNKNA